MRIYQVDATRTIAIFLLIIYHSWISFFIFMKPLGFVVNTFKAGNTTMDIFGIFMMILPIWRIPIIFLVSGMATCFSLEHRNWQGLLKERTLRILVPLIFGSFFIVPLTFVSYNYFYGIPQFYFPNPGHLWFLINIYLYCLVLLPLFAYLKNNPDNRLIKVTKYCLNIPLGVLIIFVLPMALEAVLVNPYYYSVWFDNHGLLVGLICFIIGLLYIHAGEVFWTSLNKVKVICLFIAISLFINRVVLTLAISSGQPAYLSLMLINLLSSIESVCWILSILGFISAYLNKKSTLLLYLTPAVYPMYIVHLPIQNYLATLISILTIHPFIKFIILTSGTILGCLIFY
ncbi:MAG: acyltransferase family protein, partial [Gammaproteobacteria bacterium]|nr:acyltransferase family protein [Gammaproteobacteria bacterium]